MALIVSYDDKFGTPSSEIKLDSGEHVSLTLDRTGLVITALPRPGTTECTLFKGDPDVVAKICAGLLDDQNATPAASPLKILTSAVVHLPSATAVQSVFKAAAAG